MKNTLDFYRKIYEPLFKMENYTKSLNRAGVAITKFEEFIDKNNIKVDNVIDVGCAWGKTLKYWKKKGTDVIGVDVSEKIVEKCKRQGHKSYLASATDLSMFKDKQFDLYMATDVYEHLRIKDLRNAIEEAKRITKKYLLIRPHPTLDKRGRRNIKKALHLTVWSIDQWQKFFEESGLTIVEEIENNVFLMSIKK